MTSFFSLTETLTMGWSTRLPRVSRLRDGLKKAFAIEGTTAPLSREDELLLEKMAAVVVSRGMAGPTALFLESLGPMNFLGSQALHFLTPILAMVCSTRELEQTARLLERRDALPRLVALIEAKAESGKTASR